MLKVTGKAKVTNIQGSEKFLNVDLYWSIKQEDGTYNQEFFKGIIVGKEQVDKLVNSSTFDKGSYIEITDSTLRVETYNNKKFPKAVIFACDEWIPTQEEKEEPKSGNRFSK